jgi:hypothetical protein
MSSYGLEGWKNEMLDGRMGRSAPPILPSFHPSNLPVVGSVLRRLRLRFQLLLYVEQLTVPILSPVKIFAVFLIDCHSKSDPVFDVAQFDKAVLPVIQIDTVFLENTIRSIQAILDIEKLGN